jgi:transglutaminase-like putative cysteine protease
MFNFSRISQRWRLPTWSKLQQQMLPPLIEVENSIPLRVLVLALVIVGVAATDIAAETHFSFWAVPLSCAGTTWSYYRRHSRNIPVKFCIAIGMLIALGAFFGRLFGELNDTRLALAELLIQLQVLHGFDVPRRKDLGYSIVIGVILLGVAATLSQTLAFAPMLLIFLAVALPTLAFDYRSRLGLVEISLHNPKQRKVKGQKASGLLPSYFMLFGVILVIGLGIFAVLPRFPGYQLRMFPVSSNIQVQGNFTGKNVINPGYVRKGNGKGGGNQATQGNGKGGEPGKIDQSFYYGFNSRINQNLRGEMKPKVVMRVRSQVEGFWRVLAFDKYTGNGWEISRNDQTQTLRRSPWSYQVFIPNRVFTGKTQEVVQTYTVTSDLPNLLPAMSYPREIYFPAPLVALDTEQGLRSPVELSEGFTYTVISDVPQRDRALLNLAKNKYPQEISEHYLQVPPKILDRVRQKTESILADYSKNNVSKYTKTLDSTYEKTLYLAQYVKQHFKTPDSPEDLPFLGENEDLVETFLFKYQGGYPDHFSTVLTVMLRSIGIPARLVAGYGAGQFNPFTGMYIVSNTDAYAMTEVFFPRYGWFAFDPIPGHDVIPPSIEETQTFTVLQKFWKWIAGWLPSPVTGLLNGVVGAIFGLIARFFSLFSQGWLGILQALISLTGVSFIIWLILQQWNRRRHRVALKKLPPMEGLYQTMLRWAAQKGLAKHPTQTPLEYAQTSYQQYPSHIAEIIDEISQAYVGWRYGGYKPDLPRLRQRWQQLKTEDYSQVNK